MISICCCTMNSKFDTEMFIRTLKYQNPDTEFEVIVTHDDRANDGSAERFKELEKEFPNVKFITHSHQNTLDYFERTLDYYDQRNLFQPHQRDFFRKRFELYKKGELVDNAKGFLWQSSGILYNKAVQASSGDVVIVTPGDFLYLFSLSDIEKYVRERMKNGQFYASPHAIFAKPTNLPIDWLTQHVQDVHNNKHRDPNWRYNSEEVFRDYLRYSPALDDIYIPDFYANKIIKFTDPNFFNEMHRVCTDVAKHNGIQFLPGFHGFHLMTRTTFNTIGGFSEEWFHRAWADDKMTAWGSRIYGHHTMPDHLTVCWTGQYELAEARGPGYPSEWREELPLVDPWYDKHPIPSAYGRTYLYTGLHADWEIGREITKVFSKGTSPVRIVK